MGLQSINFPLVSLFILAAASYELSQESDNSPSRIPEHVVGKSFAILTATTELQRLGLEKGNQFVWVFINGVDAFKDESTIDYDELDLAVRNCRC